MNDKLQQIAVIAATVGVITINGLAGAGYVNNITPAQISNHYPSLVTPAGYAFSIWGVIYLGLLLFSFYQALPSNTERFRSIRYIYILSCVFNCAWIFFWHQEQIALCLAIIFALLTTLAIINSRLVTTASYAEYWLVKMPFGIYFGWVTAAAILNATLALVYLKVQIFDAAASQIGAGLLLIAAALGVLIRFKLKNYFYPLAICWALIAIAFKQTGQTLIIVAAAFGVIACSVAALSFIMSMPSSSNRVNRES